MQPDYLDIDRIAFIGRTYFEYMRMFDLDESVFQKGPVLDCAAGQSSFAAEAHRSGFQVTACDVLYDITAHQLDEKGRRDISHVFDKLDEVAHLYTWKYYKDKHEIIALRHRALDRFSADFSKGLAEGRYVRAGLPCLPFPDRTFLSRIVESFSFFVQRPAGPRLSHVVSERASPRFLRRSEDFSAPGPRCKALSADGRDFLIP